MWLLQKADIYLIITYFIFKNDLLMADLINGLTLTLENIRNLASTYETTKVKQYEALTYQSNEKWLGITLGSNIETFFLLNRPKLFPSDSSP